MTAHERLVELTGELIGEAFCADWHDDPDKGVREIERIKWLFIASINAFVRDEIARDRQFRATVAGAETPTALSLDGEWNERDARNPGGSHALGRETIHEDRTGARRDEPAPVSSPSAR